MASMDSLGPEALLQASRECKFRLVRLLIDGGTLENVRNEDQETPLILACKSESEEKEKVVEFLIRKRVKVNLQDVHGKTALMYACLTNSCDNVIRMLVNCKANPWLADQSKSTAFDYAINAGNIGTVKLMIQACREGKILTKPGSFNMEMKRLEDRLDEMPEMRKCSWPLMGPRSSTIRKEKRAATQSNLLAVNEVDEATASPTRERRRKRSICHFDPIDLEGEPGESDSSTNALRKSSLASAGRSVSEDERISLHFSDSDNSSFDRSSTSFPSLEKLLRMRDSVTSSVESNDSANTHNSKSVVLKSEGALKKDSEICAALKSTETVDKASEGRKKQEDSRKGKNNVTQVQLNPDNQTEDKDATAIGCENKNDVCVGNHRKNVTNENEATHNAPVKDELIERPSAYPCGTVENQVSPRIRRRTVGSFAPSQKGDVTEDWERKRPGLESETTRRFTVGAMDMRSDERRRCPNLWGDEHSYRPFPPPKDLLSSGGRTPITVEMNLSVSSPEMRLHRKNFHSPEVDFPHSNGSAEHDLNRKLENTSVLNCHKPEVKKNAFLHFNLPVISHPENMDKEKEGTGTRKNSQVEKSTIRRTRSDSMRHEKKRACAVGSEQLRQGNSTESSSSEWNGACAYNSTADTAPIFSRERSASFTPLTTIEPNTPTQERQSYLSSTVTPCCDIVTMATSGETPRCRNSRNKLSSDLPDLVLHTPRPRARSPANLDPFSLTPELQLSDPIHTRFARSASPCTETLTLVNQAHLTGSHFGLSQSSYSCNHLPEVVSGTTGSPKELGRAAFLPPLNFSRKQQDQPEDGYFSCSPSPLDLESPNRTKEAKSKYSFKPSSPRLTNRPVKNMLP